MSDISDNSLPEKTGDSSVAVGPALPEAAQQTRILYAEDRPGSLIRDYFRTLSRYRGLILGAAICGVVVSFLISFTTLPVYRARTSLDIQSLNSDFMDMRTIAPTGNADDSSSDLYVQTQIKLLQSDTLLERSVRRMQSDPHPEFVEQMDLMSRLERGLYLVRHKPLSYDDLVADAAKKVTIKPLGVTRLVEITCDSWSADFSAKFCNTLVDQFKEAELEMRGAESQRTSDWLIQQVKDVKLKAEDSQRRLKEASGGNGLILSPNNTGVEEDRLRSLQDQYVKAQADRMEKQAEAGIGSPSAPDLNESMANQQYAVKLADLQAEVAKLVPPLTEENPQVIHLRSQIKSVQAAIASERVATATRLRSDYQASVQRETMLANAYHREVASVSAELGKASEISLLRGEVESEQQLYQTLLQRAREAGFASAMRASTVRVVDAAKPNPVPFSPRRGDSAAYGLLLGTVFGVGLAFILERSATTLRAPGDVERYLGLRELGVIPSTERERKLLPPAEPKSLNGLPAESQRRPPTLTNWTGNFSIVAEAYRSATTSIMLSEHPREKGRIYIVSSPNPGDGKTTVISNIGVALSKSRLRVLLIDGDLRRPALHKVLEVPNEFGLRNLLRGENDSDLISPEHPLYQSTELPNLFILPSGQGSEEVGELLHSAQTAKVLQRLRQHFDVVIIDTPPMLHIADARILASHAHGVILVVRSGHTSRDEASKARDIFDQDRIRLVGTILNDFDPNKTGVGDYYKSYQHYMYGPEVNTGRPGSWLDWMLSQEPWIARRTASKNGKARSANGVSEDFPNANGNGAAKNGVSNGSNGSHGTPFGEIIPPSRSQQTFFMKVLGWNSGTESKTDELWPRDDQEEPYVPGTHERRRATRKESPQLIAYYWDSGAPVAHSIRDISLSGIYTVSNVRWYPGTQVMIALQRLDVADGEPNRSITVNAKVVRNGVDGLGFSFVMPDKRPPRNTGPYSRRPQSPSIPGGADRAAIISFLQKLPKDQDQG